ncbi:hypothetical protein ACFOW1_04940 [Parasediminibacterium paludis]|uniref:Uncharacterized protein n=1 Tax=Parasediminibacterium paludis TaxID=908966 RepID=A0ABV8PW91_9BACT
MTPTDFATLQLENERLQMIITALAEQNRQLQQQVMQLQALYKDTSNLAHPNGWMQTDASNQPHPNGWISTDASNRSHPNGCMPTNTSNQDHPNGWIQTDASNRTSPNGYIPTNASNQDHPNGWIPTDASNRAADKEALHPNAAHFVTLPKPLQIDMALFKHLLREAGVGINSISLTSSATILWFCIQQPLHSSAKLMALTGFSEGGVSKRLIALKKLQLLHRSGYQYYTLTPKAIAIVKQALV